LWIERAPRRKLVDELASKLVGGDDGLTGTPTVTQQLGFGGTGVTVCVADTGLDTGDTNTMHPDLLGRVTGFQYYGNAADGTPLTDGSDGYGHGTHCAGIVAGNAATGETDPDTGAWYGLGVASRASLFIERIFDDAANEVTPPTSIQPYIAEFSACNAGPDTETMDSPASGKNVIATGACENVPGTLAMTYGLYADGQDTMADFS